MYIIVMLRIMIINNTKKSVYQSLLTLSLAIHHHLSELHSFTWCKSQEDKDLWL